MTMLQMIQHQTGERRVIDTVNMTASEFLHHADVAAPLKDYELDCRLTDADLAVEYAVVRADA